MKRIGCLIYVLNMGICLGANPESPDPNNQTNSNAPYLLDDENRQESSELLVAHWSPVQHATHEELALAIIEQSDAIQSLNNRCQTMRTKIVALEDQVIEAQDQSIKKSDALVDVRQRLYDSQQAVHKLEWERDKALEDKENEAEKFYDMLDASDATQLQLMDALRKANTSLLETQMQLVALQSQLTFEQREQKQLKQELTKRDAEVAQLKVDLKITNQELKKTYLVIVLIIGLVLGPIIWHILTIIKQSKMVANGPKGMASPSGKAVAFHRA